GAGGSGAERRQDVLRRRLAGRAGDPDDARARPVPNERAERRHRGERLLRDERRGRASSQRLLAVVGPAPDRHEQVAGLDAARIDLDALDHVVARVERTERWKLVDAKLDHAVAPSRRSASRATSRSSNGIVRSANSWPCSWPLPAIRTTSPSPASEIACSIAVDRSDSTS